MSLKLIFKLLPGQFKVLTRFSYGAYTLDFSPAKPKLIDSSLNITLEDLPYLSIKTIPTLYDLFCFSVWFMYSFLL